MLVPAYSE